MKRFPILHLFYFGIPYYFGPSFVHPYRHCTKLGLISSLAFPNWVHLLFKCSTFLPTLLLQFIAFKSSVTLYIKCGTRGPTATGAVRIVVTAIGWRTATTVIASTISPADSVEGL